MAGEFDDFFTAEPEEEFTRLPYGIRERTIYYMCIRCGTIMTSDEMAQFADLMCKNCGGRIFVKLRPPPEVVRRRKIRAI